MKFDLNDFELLWWTAMGNFSHEQPYRFEKKAKYTSRTYKDGEGFLYWVGHQDSFSDALIAFKILEAEGYEPNLLWDTAENENGSYGGYCILTTYQYNEHLDPWVMGDADEGVSANG